MISIINTTLNGGVLDYALNRRIQIHESNTQGIFYTCSSIDDIHDYILIVYTNGTQLGYALFSYSSSSGILYLYIVCNLSG